MHDAPKPLESAPRAHLGPTGSLARVLLATVSPDHAVDVLIAEFGWDRAFQALAACDDVAGRRAFADAWERLIFGPLTRSATPSRPRR